MYINDPRTLCHKSARKVPVRMYADLSETRRVQVRKKAQCPRFSRIEPACGHGAKAGERITKGRYGMRGVCEGHGAQVDNMCRAQRGCGMLHKFQA